MILSAHQPHYFSWLGFFDKMAKADIFVLCDEVQLEIPSPMTRNSFLGANGGKAYLSVSINRNHFLDKKMNEITLAERANWQKKHRECLLYWYHKADYFSEIWKEIEWIFEKKYSYLYEIDNDTITILRKLLDINTKIVFQSHLNYEKSMKKNDLIVELCKTCSANIYLSGKGALKYMDPEKYKKNGIEVIYQTFECPTYYQVSSNDFVSNLSSLDLLFNCGINKSREIFWNNVRTSNKGEQQ